MPSIRLDLEVNDKGTIKIKRFADTASKGARKAEGSFDKLGASIKRLGPIVVASATLATAAIAEMGRQSILAASDFEETQGKFSVVFKGHMQQAESLAKELADDYAMSENAAKSFMSQMQDMLKPMGMVAGEATKMSSDIVKLAADLGSFNNVPTADALRALRAALVGEFEPMRQFGTMLSVAKIESEALARGLIKTKDELTPLIKAQVAYTLAVENNKDAVGDLERTQGSFANQMKRAKADLDDLKVTIGNHLLPKATEYLQILNQWVEKNDELIKQKVSVSVDKTASALEKLIGIYNGLPDGVIGAAGTGIVARIISGSNPIGMLVASLVLLNEQLDTFGLNLGSLKQKYDGLAGVSEAFLATLEGKSVFDKRGEGVEFGFGERTGGGKELGFGDRTQEDMTPGLVDTEKLIENQELVKELTHEQLKVLSDANEEFTFKLIDMEYQKLAAKEDAEAQATKITQDELKKRATLEKQFASAKSQVDSSVYNNLVGFIRAIAPESKSAALAAIAITKAQSIAQIAAYTEVAATLAFASQLIPGDLSSPARAAAVAQAVRAKGALSMGLVAATGIVEGLSVINDDESTSREGLPGGAADRGNITPSTGTDTTVGGAELVAGIPASAGPTITVHIHGDVVDHDEFARNIIPSITKAISDGVR